MSRKKSGRTTGRGRGGGVTSVDDGPYVSVFCAGTEAAPHEKWRIATFYPDAFEGEVIWMSHARSYYDPSSHFTIHVAGSVTQRLEGDTWIATTSRDHDIHSPSFRTRWNLECRQCGLRKVVAQPRTFYPVFTALAQLQIPEVELLHLIHSGRHADSH